MNRCLFMYYKYLYIKKISDFVDIKIVPIFAPN